MTQDRNTLEEKRQEVLQRLRNRRGEARRGNVGQNKSDDQDDPVMRPFLRLRELQVDVARGVDVSQQTSELKEEDKQVETFLELRKAKRAKRLAAQQPKTEINQNDPQLSALVGEDDKVKETFLSIREARRASRGGKRKSKTQPQENEGTSAGRGRRRLDSELPSSTDFVRNVQQLLGSTETALSSMPLEELEQRRKDLKYRYDWMRSLVEEMREELDKLQDNIIARLRNPTDTKEENGHPTEPTNQ